MNHFWHILAILLLAFEVGAALPGYHRHSERQEAVVTVTVTVPAVPDPTDPPPPPPPPPGHGHHQHPHHNHHHQPHANPQDHKPQHQFGISYSPYRTDGTCKTQEEVTADLASLSPEYAYIRIYGVDCNQTATVTTAAKQHDVQVFAGIFDLSDFPNSLNPIIETAKKNSPSNNNNNNNPDTSDNDNDDGWAVFHTIAIGNELVAKNQNTADDVTSAIHRARSILRAAGYHGPVVTVDVYSTLLENPSLCDASDYCASNCHVFFDATQTPENAGTYARDVARKISKKAGGKRTVIAESGWPHAGRANGKAVPSEENQRVAVGSLRREFHGQGDIGLVLFTAFDDLWKVDREGTFGAEKFWGIQQ